MRGRFVVLITKNNFITVSQKIENREEKERLKEIVSELLKDKNIGAIIRTSAANKSKEELEKDIKIALEKLEYVINEY